MLRVLMLTAAILMFPTVARADVITQQGVISGSGQPDYTQVYDDFTGFDTSLGALQDAYVTANLFLNASFEYGSAIPPTPSTTVAITFDIASTLGGQSSFVVRSTQTQVARYNYNGGYYLPIQAAASPFIGVFSGSAFTTLATGSGFSLELGGAAQALAYAYYYVSGIPGSITPAFEANATVTYIYQPAVPEPSTLLIVSSALAALAFIRRRLTQ